MRHLRKFVTFTLTAALLVLVLTGCGDKTTTPEENNEEQAENTNEEQTAEIPTITESELAAADKNTLIALEGNATTGYSWFVSDYDANALNVNTLGYLPAESNGMVGTGGIYYYYVTAADNASAGEYVVSFAYYRSWEGIESAVNKASVIITIDAQGVVTASTPEIS